jgi:hypothetical protein
MARFPALKSRPPDANGVNRRPAVEAVDRVGREQEAAVSGHGPVQETPEGCAALQSGLFAGEEVETAL